jgi:putative Holliday junction resolvase
MPKQKIHRLMGIDYGTKRVGVSISSEDISIAFPLVVIKNTSELAREIEKIAKEHEVKEIVVGESRDFKGNPNPIFLETEKLKKELETMGFIVHLELEFMTSMQAERLQGKNEKIDASAATIILQSYIDRIKNQ